MQTQITYEEFLMEILASQKKNKGQRYGQAAYTIAWNLKPDITDAVCEKLLDPYYSNDDTIANVFINEFIRLFNTSRKISQEEGTEWI